MFHKAAGLLYCKGALSPKKYEPFFIIITDATLQQWSTGSPAPKHTLKKGVPASVPAAAGDRGILLALFPLANGSLVPISKKEKTHTPYAFAISGLGPTKEKDKWQTIFCVESQAMLDKFLTAFHASLNLSKRNIFGTTIRDACLKSNRQVPDLIYSSCQKLLRDAKTDGLFRNTGDLDYIQEISDSFDRGETPTDKIDKADPHVVAGLLKSYIRSLSDPLVPFSQHKDFLGCASLSLKEQKEWLKKSILKLPPENCLVLHYLVLFLIKLATDSGNKADIKTLSTIFGPIIIRPELDPISEGKGPTKETIEASVVFQVLLECGSSVFPEIEDQNWFSLRIADPDVELVKLSRRRFLSNAEAPVIDALLKMHQDPLSPSDQWIPWLCHIQKIGAKPTPPEFRILIVDRHRIYSILPGSAKCEFDVHFNDLTSLISPNKFQLQITWNSAKEKMMTSVIISPICFLDAVVDAILEKVCTEYQKNFIGRNWSGLSLVLDPEERQQALLKKTAVADPNIACGGLLWTYLTLCDFYPFPSNPNIIADIEDYFQKNKIHELFLEDMLSPATREKFSNPEFEILMMSLRFNTWFKSLICDNNQLTSDGLTFVAKCMEHNETLTTLSLKNTGGKGTGLQVLFEAFLANPKLALTDFSIAGNALDSSGSCKAFAQTLGSGLKNLRSLDLSNVQMYKHGWGYFFTELNTVTNLFNTLVDLDLSNNRLVDKHAAELGTFLANTKVLANLNLSAATISLSAVTIGMGDSICPSCRKLDLSKVKMKTLQSQQELILFLAKLPMLTDVNVAMTELPASSLQRIWHKGIVTLDISDNDLSDAGITSFCDFVSAQHSKQPVDLINLSMNRVFSPSHRKPRALALAAISNMLMTIPIVSFQLRGAGKSALKTDLIDIVLGVLNNITLRSLDVQGHLGGDRFANVISKVLQHNNTLDSLNVDGNAITIKGLRAYRLGLERNANMKHLPLPLLDLSKFQPSSDPTGMAKMTGMSTTVNSQELQQQIREHCSRIQKILTENSIIFPTTNVIISDTADDLESEDLNTMMWSKKATLRTPGGPQKRDPRRLGRLKKKPDVSPLTLGRDVMIPRASGYGTYRSNVSKPFRLSIPIDHSIPDSEDSGVTDSGVSERDKRKLRTLFSTTEGSSESADTARERSEDKLDPHTKKTPIRNRFTQGHSDKRSSEGRNAFRSKPENPKPDIIGIDLFADIKSLPKPESDEIRRKTRQWNTEFQSIYEREPSLDKYLQMNQLMNDFKQVSRDIARLIVVELHSVFRTLEPVGRNEYHCQGITFKVAMDYRVDEKFYYGNASKNDFCATKTLFRNYQLNQYHFDLFQTTCQTTLRIPLVSLTQYKGFIIIATASLPMASEKPPKTQDVLDAVKAFSTSLNIGTFTYKDTSDNTTSLIHGPELSLASGIDNRVYYLDLSSSMPPEYPLFKPNNIHHFPDPQSVYYNLLRPFFVTSYPVPLVAPCLTSLAQNDPKRESYAKTLKDATTFLFEVQIPKFATEADATPFNANDLIAKVHSYGINLRHLGRIRSLCKSAEWKTGILEECFVRALKNIVRTSLRYGEGSTMSRFSHIEVFNSLLIGELMSPCWLVKSGASADTTWKGRSVKVNSQSVLVRSAIPISTESFYFEIEVKEFTESIHIAVSSSNQQKKDGVTLHERERVGVLINRKIGFTQFFVGNEVGKVVRLSDRSVELFPTIFVDGTASFEFNFGPISCFDFQIASYCEKLGLSQPSLPGDYSSLFWTISHDGYFQESIKSFKNQLVSSFPYIINAGENESNFDLRSIVDRQGVYRRVTKTLAITPSPAYLKKIEKSTDITTPLTNSDFLGFEPLTKTLLSSFLEEIITLSTTLLNSQVTSPSALVAQAEAKAVYLTSLEQFIYCQFLYLAAQQESKPAPIFSKLLAQLKILISQLPGGKLLRDALLLQGKVLIQTSKKEDLKDIEGLTEVIASYTVNSIILTSKRDDASLSELRNEIRRSLKCGRFIVECSKQSFETHGHFPLEFLVAQISLYSVSLMTSEQNVLEGSSDLITKALGKLERAEIATLFEVLLGRGYASGSSLQGLHYIAQFNSFFQKQLNTYLADNEPTICSDSPFCSIKEDRPEKSLSHDLEKRDSSRGTLEVKATSDKLSRHKTKEKLRNGPDKRFGTLDTIHSAREITKANPKMSNPSSLTSLSLSSFNGLSLIGTTSLCAFRTGSDQDPKHFFFLANSSDTINLYSWNDTHQKWTIGKSFESIARKGGLDFVVFPPRAIALFIRGQNDDCLWALTKNVEQQDWTNWESLGGSLSCDPVVVFCSAQQKYIFARQSNDQLQMKDISAVEWGPLVVQSEILTFGPLSKVTWDSKVLLLSNSKVGYVYTIFNGVTSTPWAKIDYQFATPPIVILWGTSVLFVAVLGLNNSGELIQRNMDTASGTWEGWTKVSSGVPFGASLKFVQWNKNCVTLLIQTSDHIWSSFGNGSEWNDWVEVK